MSDFLHTRSDFNELLVIAAEQRGIDPVFVENEWLSKNIAIPGIDTVERDTAFDDEKMRRTGIRLRYHNRVGQQSGVKDGVLLKLGFDDTTPNRPRTISSWAYDAAINAGVQIRNNRAVDVLCYLPTYTCDWSLRRTRHSCRKMVRSEQVLPASIRRRRLCITTDSLTRAIFLRAFINSSARCRESSTYVD